MSTVEKNMKPLLLTVLTAAALTTTYFVIFALLHLRSIERSLWGTWGFVGYLIIMSLSGFLLTGRSSYKMSLLCSTVIPVVFTLAIIAFLIIFPDSVRISVFNQYSEYHETIRYGAMLIMVLALFGGATVFALSAAVCGLRADRKGGIKK